MQQEAVALCLSERQFGNARTLNDFALLDVSTGVGLGVISGGRTVTGRSGLAGEIGHITVQPDGHICGCGNRGCLETVASDSAFAWAVSRTLEREVTVDEAIDLHVSGRLDTRAEVEQIILYLGIGLAAVINLFNPSTLFVHGRLLSADPALFPMLVEETKRRTLAPSFQDCHIVLARGSKRQGAIAAIIDHLTSSLVPMLNGHTAVAHAAPAR
jgi:N-acetylglucosamine repressor